MKADLNEEIRKLKDEGASLRKIGTTLHLSHEAIRKRLKNLAGRELVSTTERNQELTPSAIEKEKVSTGSNARKSRASVQIRETVNEASTSKAPSHTLSESVNSSGTHSNKPSECMRGVFHGVPSEVDGLSEQIKQFLQSKGIEIYRMQVSQEAYQVKHNGQVVRFYVERKNRV